jgi:hypothetical protein
MKLKNKITFEYKILIKEILINLNNYFELVLN